MMIPLGQVQLYVRSMGKWLKVTAIAETVADANAYSTKHDEAAVVACLPGDRLILMADRYDPGEKVKPEDIEPPTPRPEPQV